MKDRMSFGNVPRGMLVGAIEKLLAKIDETDLATLYERDLSTMPLDFTSAFVEALFAAFRNRGESSEDAAEDAGTTLASIERRDADALRDLIRYARSNPDLLKEATALLVEARPDLVGTLPVALRDGVAERLTATQGRV